MAFHTQSWLINTVLFIIGVAILVKGSNWLVHGAGLIAVRRRWNPTIVGLTLVSIGTSLPELATNLTAIGTGSAGVALGNVVGSNIANILLILGICVSCLGLVRTDRTLFQRDAMVMLALTVLFAGLCYTGAVLGRWEGLLLLGLMGWYLHHLIRARNGEAPDDLPSAEEATGGLARPMTLAALGLGLLVLGARLMVDTVAWAGVAAGVAPELIAATVVAVGTSLPELAVTVAGILKKQTHLAMGNIIGSNIFNIVGIMGITAALVPVPVAPEAQRVLLPVMLLSTVALVVGMRSAWALVRWEGVALLSGYAGFVAYNVFQVLP